MADQIDDDDDPGANAPDRDLPDMSPEFSQRSAGVIGSRFWSASRPGGPDWPPNDNPTSKEMIKIAEFSELMLDQKYAMLEAIEQAGDYDKLTPEAKARYDEVEKFNEMWMDLEARAIMQAEEQLSFVGVGNIPLTDSERQAATDAAQQAKQEGRPDIAKWLANSLDSNPNAVRSVLAEMRFEEDEE
jgi:hypothetical protein